jgi:hypothetical protein
LYRLFQILSIILGITYKWACDHTTYLIKCQILYSLFHVTVSIHLLPTEHVVCFKIRASTICYDNCFSTYIFYHFWMDNLSYICHFHNSKYICSWTNVKHQVLFLKRLSWHKRSSNIWQYVILKLFESCYELLSIEWILCHVRRPLLYWGHMSL